MRLTTPLDIPSHLPVSTAADGAARAAGGEHRPGLPSPIRQVRGGMKVCQNVGGISKPASAGQQHSSPLIGVRPQRHESLPRRYEHPKGGPGLGCPHFTEQHWAGWEEPPIPGGALALPKGPRYTLPFPLPSGGDGEPRGQAAGVYTAGSLSRSPGPTPDTPASAAAATPASARVVWPQHNPVGSGPSSPISR